MSELSFPLGFGVEPISGLGASTLGEVDWTGSLFVSTLAERASVGVMTDARLDFSSELLTGDAAVEAGDLAIESGLGSAVLMSLFTDRRALPDQAPPDGSDDPRGWWGDGIALVDGDEIGSRLWLLLRRKATGETRRLAEDACREALDWLIEDDICERIDVAASFVRGSDGTRLEIELVLHRPGLTADARFSFVWPGG